MFRRKTKIERLCRETGNWALSHFDKHDHFTVRTTSSRTVYPITVLHHPRRKTTRFQCFLPVRFPLGNAPSGLFGRLLLRNWDLAFSAWSINIGQSCEATACVAALIPSDSLDAQLFDDICEEQAREVADFHRELREKFNWAGQNPHGFDPHDVRISGNASVPSLRPDGSTHRYR